ncbi:MAG: TetR/AcrR family transcriptional regulator [Kofleriaceae bacterium]
MSTSKPEGSARERLLAAANELFYEEGVHTVGIDRVIERAGVAKASLYSTFGSKEELVRAYLQQRAEQRQLRMSTRIARHEDPREQILSLFDSLGEATADPKYRGCAFINASAEGRRDEASKVSQVCLESRTWVRGLFTELARNCGANDPDELGRQLVCLYDGAAVAASMERDLTAAGRAKAMASTLIDSQTKTKAK